ncbi:MFS siderochrome iron transporter 1 [Xylographa opegraphella]|nr:MFS siderochrome iron transporter 1 [Xylographa opegraphella]
MEGNNMESETSSHTVNDADAAISTHSSKPAHWRVVFSHSLVTDAVLTHKHRGAGTDDDPYVVDFIPHDPRNPMDFSMLKKWTLTLLVAFATLCVSFASSAYTGDLEQVIGEFGCSDEVATLGLSLFVLGFAFGPLLWAPLSELYGRQILFFGTYMAFTAFNAGNAGSPNIQTLIVLRFFCGLFGSSPLTNAGGVIADMFPASQRGLAMSVFAAAPFMGPTLGPIIGGFVGESVGWRWTEGVIAIFSGSLWLLGAFTIPETYPPVLLRKRAAALSKATGKVYRSKMELSSTKPSLRMAFKVALSRPWILLCLEPIVLLLSIYMSIIYGTLYLAFGAWPIVYQENRGWSEGVGGLAFVGIAIGMLGGVIYTIPDNKRYNRAADQAKADGSSTGAPPEARLPPAIIGCVLLPVGLFWFAWTNGPSVHWIVSIIATVPFGMGMVLVFLSIMNYLIDAYTIYAASVLAASSVLRSLFGTVFPLFTVQMYDNLGIHWASTIPAFLALMCVPFPFLFYKYGATIRKKCKYSRIAQEEMAKIMQVKDDSEMSDGEKGVQDSERADPRTEALEEEETRELSPIRERHSDFVKDNQEAEARRESRGDVDRDLEKGGI